MAQQATPQTQPNVPVPLETKEALIKHEPCTAGKPVDIPVEKQPEQAGFMNFIKSAVGIEEPMPDAQKCSQISSNEQSKTCSTASLPGSVPTNKEATGVSNLFGSISSLFSAEPPPPQKQQMKPSVTEDSLTSASKPKGLQRQRTMDQSSSPVPSQPPNKSISQPFPPSSLPGPFTSRSETMPTTEQKKNETKPSGGLFGFSIGEMLSGSATAQSGPTPQSAASTTAPQEESLGKSILSIFSGPNPPQAATKTEPLPQARPPSAAPQPPQQESLGKSLLSMFGGSSPPQPPPQTKPTADVPQQGTVPPKDPPNTGFLSMFGGPSNQQQAQTGSLLGGILPGSTSSTESPMKGLFSMFSEPSPPQPQPTTPLSQQRVAKSQTQLQGEPNTQSKPQAQPQGQGQPAASVLGGILGGFSTSSDTPKSTLFSMFSGPSTPQSAGAAPPKEQAKSIFSVFNDVLTPPQPPQQTPNSSSTFDTKVPPTAQGSSQISSVTSSHGQAAPSEISSDVNVRSSKEATVDTSQDATNKGTDIASMDPDSEIVTVQKETSTESAPQDPTTSNQSPASGFLSMISGSDPKDPPGKGLMSLLGGSAPQPSFQPESSLLGAMFGGSSTQKPASQTGGSLLGGLFGGSAPQASPQSGAHPTPGPQTGGSLLGGLFGGSAPQAFPQSGAPPTPGPQTGGSLFGGLFGGSAPQVSTQVGPNKSGASPTQGPNAGASLLGSLFGGSAPQVSTQVGPNKSGASPTPGPQAGVSLLGGLFGGSAPQAAGSPTAGSILGGIFGGSAASTTAPQTSGSFGGLFGGTAAQTSTTPNTSSILGGILGGSSSQTAPAQTVTSAPNRILPEASAPNEIPGKSLPSILRGSVPPALTATTSIDDEKTSTTALTDTTSDVTILPKPDDDSKTAPALAGPEIYASGTVTKSNEKAETLQQPGSTVQCVKASLPKTDGEVTKEAHHLDADKPTTKAIEIQSKESELSTPELLSGQSGQNATLSKVEEATPATQSASTVVEEQQKPTESDKSIGDTAADAVTGFMSSLFKPTVASSEVPQQQQKNSLFGHGATAPQAATGQSGGSLLGGIFGGSNTETAAPQIGGSLLGGLFKGSAPQSGPQTPAPTPGGSILGGMFGGGSTAKSVGPQTGGSLLGGMFGGSAATAQPGGSLLGGMFGGATAQTAGSQAGASILGGIGGTLFGGVGQPPKPTEPKPAESNAMPAITPQSQIKNESVPPTVSPSGTETTTNKKVEPTLTVQDQVKSGNLTSSSEVASEAACPETSVTYDTTHPGENSEKETPAVEGDIIHEKPMVIKGDSESKECDKSVPPDNKEAHTNLAPPVNQLPINADPPEAKSLFGFMSTQSDAGKSFGSLFSQTPSSGTPSMPQTEGVSGLFSGFKTLSGGLFQDEKPVAGKQEPPTTSLFGTKISFPWQAEPPKPQAPVVTSQPKTDNKATLGQTQTVQKVATADAQKSELVGSTDDVANPQICISTPEVDSSASLTPKEKEGLVETYPSAGPTSGVQLDIHPVESSRFGSSGNLSQTSSQLSETGQSTGGSELEESFHSYHSTSFHPSTNGQLRTNGQPPTNGHYTVGEQEIHRLTSEEGQGLKKDTPTERGTSKLLRFQDDGPPLPFTPSRICWLKAINKVRVQLREISFVLEYIARGGKERERAKKACKRVGGGMFPRGHSGQDEPYKSELLPLSPKRQDLEEKRSKSPNVGRSLRRKLQKCLQGIEDNSLSDLSSVDTTCTKADLILCGEKPSSDCLVGVGVLEDTLPKLIERIKNKEEKKEMEDEDAEQGSGNIVEHILKELKGINKIQEEISDLRQYLTSVRGSVDEASYTLGLQQHLNLVLFLKPPASGEEV
ncbi:hypothetical protein NQZ68_014440 [Dissostichus eleginoides]|nr:hypothetical protein NQZ68_014440 [Dissostichus eleginoides]